MSQENVDVIRTFYDRWDARDLGPAFELPAPNVEWQTAPTSLSAGRTIHGVKAVLEHMEELLDAEAREEAGTVIERIIDLGAEVLVLERETYVGRAVVSARRREPAAFTRSRTAESSVSEAS